MGERKQPYVCCQHGRAQYECETLRHINLTCVRETLELIVNLQMGEILMPEIPGSTMGWVRKLLEGEDNVAQIFPPREFSPPLPFHPNRAGLSAGPKKKSPGFANCVVQNGSSTSETTLESTSRRCLTQQSRTSDCLRSRRRSTGTTSSVSCASCGRRTRTSRTPRRTKVAT